MQYVLTRTQKLALVLLALLVLLAGWYVGIYTPIKDRIRVADRAGLEDEIAQEQMKASKIKAMQAEIDENRASGAPVVPSYNNFKQELEQLNEVYGRAYEFSFTFSEPEVDGTGVRRNIAVYCEAENYDAAAELMRQILQGPYRSMIHDVSINSMARALPNQMADLKKGRVSLSFNMTYYETTVGADSLEGLPVEETQQAQADGLANSDLSDLQRSDLETAAEAALGE